MPGSVTVQYKTLTGLVNCLQEAAEVIVKTPGLLEALIEMCRGQHNSDRFTAMGTIQNLTRSYSLPLSLSGSS